MHGSAAASKASITCFAIQCNLDPQDDDEAGPAGAAGSEAAECIVAGSAEWRTLGELEYALRLASAECREETSHMLLAVRLPHGVVGREDIACWQVGAVSVTAVGQHHCAQDERLQMALSNPGLQRPSSADKHDRGEKSTRSLDTVAKNFSKLGFGSPVP